MSSILDGVNSSLSEKRAEQTSIGLTDKKSLSNLKTGGIDVKKMVNDLNSMEDSVVSQTVNNMAYRGAVTATKNSAIQGRGQYASTYAATNTTKSITPLLNKSNSLHLQNYQAGAQAYFNNLSAVYSSVGNLADLKVEAELYDGQNQIQWANQALSESEFEEEKRHTNVVLDQAEAAKAKADAAAKAASSGGGSGGSGGYSSYSTGGGSGSGGVSGYVSGGGSSSGASAGGNAPSFNVDAGSNPNTSKSNEGSKNPVKDTAKYVKTGDYDAGVRVDAVEGPEAPEKKESTDKWFLDFEDDGFFH